MLADLKIADGGGVLSTSRRCSGHKTDAGELVRVQHDAHLHPAFGDRVRDSFWYPRHRSM